MKTPSRASAALARLYLRRVTTLGRRPYVTGRPSVTNRGRLDIGDDFVLASEPVPSHMFVARGGHLSIGHSVTIGSGVAISCAASVHIGDGVRIGRNVLVLDSDFHQVDALSSPGKPSPIVVEDGARLDDGVIVLKGARVGAGAHVGPSSVVARGIRRGVFACGVPARARQRSARAGSGDLDRRVRAIVADTFDVPREIARVDGPATLAEWDSLGLVHLALAIEDVLGVRLEDAVLAQVRSVGALIDLVESAFDSA